MFNRLFKSGSIRLLTPALLVTVLLAQSGNVSGSTDNPVVSQDSAVRLAGIIMQTKTVIASAPIELVPDKANRIAALDEALTGLAGLSQYQLASLDASLSRNPGFYEIPITLVQAWRPATGVRSGTRAAAPQPADVPQSRAAVALAQGPQSRSAAFLSPSEPIHAASLLDPDGEPCPTSPTLADLHNKQDEQHDKLNELQIAQDIEYALEAVNDLIPPDMTEGTAPGVTISHPNPAHIVSSIAFFAAKTATFVIQQQYDNLQVDLDNIQQDLDNIDECTGTNHENILQKFSARERISLEIVELKPKMRFLVVGAERGHAEDMEFLSIKIADPNDIVEGRNLMADGKFDATLLAGLTSAKFSQEMIDAILALREPGPWINITPLFTATQVTDGQFLLSLDPKTPAVLLNKSSLYEVYVKDTHVDGGDSWEHFGYTVFQRNRSDNLFLGQ